jgi:hypothetical protein
MSNYPPDRTWGALIALMSGLCGCGVLVVTFFLNILLGIFHMQAAEAGSSPVVFGALSVVIVIVGIMVAAFYLLMVIGGLGIMNGYRWAFNLVMVVGIINAILHIGQLPHGLIGMAIDLACVYYCYQRLTGNVGPRPL